MPDWIESCLAPFCKELIDSAPSVKYCGETILLEHPVGFLYRGLEPVAIRIILDRAA
jgi:hypothetical protein